VHIALVTPIKLDPEQKWLVILAVPRSSPLLSIASEFSPDKF
jgi:hypothetical protein